MWTCKYCDKEFDFKTLSEKGNHSRWCNENPNKRSTDNMKLAQQKRSIIQCGEDKEFTVICNNCKKDFIVVEKKYKFPTKDRYYCSDKCARSFSAKVNVESMENKGELHYKTVCKRHNSYSCIICNFNKILDVHHVNEDNTDNRKENLIYLCPNHHKMYHSRFKKEIVPFIEKYILSKWGCNSVG